MSENMDAGRHFGLVHMKVGTRCIKNKFYKFILEHYLIYAIDQVYSGIT